MIRDIVNMLPGFSVTDGQKIFTIRHGICFGMPSKEVIRIERKNGFRYREYETDDGSALYDSGYNYQLNYDVRGKSLGNIPLERFEYNFTRADKRLYQFYYVFGNNTAESFMTLSLALQQKFGQVADGGHATEKCESVGSRVLLHHGWNFPEDENNYIIAADLWTTILNRCFLAFERKRR